MSDYIIFSIGESDYALEVASVDRIDQIPKLTPIPNAHPFIEGLMTYQDHTLKVVSFRKMTGVPCFDEGESSPKILIYRAQQEGDGGMFAIKVDGIKDIVAIDDTMIKSYSHKAKVGACLQTRGVIEYKKSLVVVIDTVKLPDETQE